METADEIREALLAIDGVIESAFDVLGETLGLGFALAMQAQVDGWRMNMLTGFRAQRAEEIVVLKAIDDAAGAITPETPRKR